MTNTLGLTVTGQHIKITEPVMLVAGTVNIYTAVFSFDAEWDDYIKTAVFKCTDIEKEQLLSGNSCTVPWEVKRRFRLSRVPAPIAKIEYDHFSAARARNKKRVPFYIFHFDFHLLSCRPGKVSRGTSARTCLHSRTGSNSSQCYHSRRYHGP